MTEIWILKEGGAQARKVYPKRVSKPLCEGGELKKLKERADFSAVGLLVGFSVKHGKNFLEPPCESTEWEGLITYCKKMTGVTPKLILIS